MFKSQLEKIIAEKSSAFKVLMATKKQLEASCKKAKDFVNLNLNEINEKEQEIINKKEMNTALNDQVLHMEASIVETDRIVNPEIDGIDQKLDSMAHAEDEAAGEERANA